MTQPAVRALLSVKIAVNQKNKNDRQRNRRSRAFIFYFFPSQARRAEGNAPAEQRKEVRCPCPLIALLAGGRKERAACHSLREQSTNSGSQDPFDERKNRRQQQTSRARENGQTTAAPPALTFSVAGFEASPPRRHPSASRARSMHQNGRIASIAASMQEQ